MSRRPEPRRRKVEPRSRPRCSWPGNPLAIRYHDREWGVPVRSDRKLFEFLILEGAQAGLSWDTILAKRENYRAALDGFDFQKIARYDAKKKKRPPRPTPASCATARRSMPPSSTRAPSSR